MKKNKCYSCGKTITKAKTFIAKNTHGNEVEVCISCYTDYKEATFLKLPPNIIIPDKPAEIRYEANNDKMLDTINLYLKKIEKLNEAERSIYMMIFEQWYKPIMRIAKYPKDFKED